MAATWTKLFEKIDTDGSWEKLKKKVGFDDAETDEKQKKLMLKRLTDQVLKDFIERYSSDGERRKALMMLKRLTLTRCPHETQSSVEEESCLVSKKHKKQTKTIDMEEPKEKKIVGNAKDKKEKIKKQKTETHIAEFIKSGLELIPPDMPQDFKDCILQQLQGSGIKLVIQKPVEVTDLRKSQNRFSMPEKKIKNWFLRRVEEDYISTNKKDGMELVFVEPSLEVSKVHLSKWKIGNSNPYILKTEWGSIVRKNQDSLKPYAVVQVWSFRMPGSKLGFAMIKVRDGLDGIDID